MHEYGVVQNVVDLIMQRINEKPLKVTDINLVIGELSSYVDDSIQFYFDILSKDTPLDGAKLHFKRVPAVFGCTHCGAEFTRRGMAFVCPFCGGDGAYIRQGMEFYIESIEVEERGDKDLSKYNEC